MPKKRRSTASRKSSAAPPVEDRQESKSIWPYAIGTAVLIGITLYLWLPDTQPIEAEVPVRKLARSELLPTQLADGFFSTGGPQRAFMAMGPHDAKPRGDDQKMVYWWDGLPPSVEQTAVSLANFSNIRKRDYAGPDACQKCHSENYDHWKDHPHHKMNMLATEENVVGDFSGGPESRIEYRGGLGTFYREDGDYRMRLERDGIARTFKITRTIGARFFQYYIGLLVDGPLPEQLHPNWPSENFRTVEHVLPFGFWIDEKEWVPVVHVGTRGEPPDDERDDPFLIPSRDPYTIRCSQCHTTLPVGDWMLRAGSAKRMDEYTPHFTSFFASDFMAQEYPNLLPTTQAAQSVPTQEAFRKLYHTVEFVPHEQNTVTLGISCEACHFGCKQHAEDEKTLPKFFPNGEQVLVFDKNNEGDDLWGRNDRNLNFVCARCHSGTRPQFAAGMSTWNSTELTDAYRGHCYDPDLAAARGMQHLTCVHCHNPHEPTGKVWQRTPEQDDASCLSCHQDLEPAPARVAHTHHPIGTSGSRCMNCHMPKLHEGLQDVIRTHTIFNPTDEKMIESNQPNACNLCHVDKPIDWTLTHLKDWYGKTYSEQALVLNYPNRTAAAAVGWLKSSHEPTRMAAAAALTDAKAEWALDHLISALDDPYLLNRQFAQRGIERMLDVDLRDYGYRHFQQHEERLQPIQKIRLELK